MQDHSKEFAQLGRAIAYYRKIRNMTQDELAEAVNISRTHLCNIESPNVLKSASLNTLFNISDALHISPGDLFNLPAPDDTDADDHKKKNNRQDKDDQ